MSAAHRPLRSAALLVGFAVLLGAQEPGITRQQAEAILNELRQIRLLLERTIRAAAAAQGPDSVPKAKLRIESGHVLGAKDAPLTMIEFTDYQCGFCRQFHLVTFPELRKKYIDTGKLRFYSRDLPLEMHSNAFHAAEAARCAGDQGKFWEMRDVLVSNANKLAPDDIAGYAEHLNLKMPAFRSCLDSGKHRQTIQNDVAEAASLNIGGTPSFVIGRSTADGVDGEVFVGAQPLAAFEAKLKEFESGK